MSEFKEKFIACDDSDLVMYLPSEKTPNEKTLNKNENLSDESIKFGDVISPSEFFGLKKKKKKKPFLLGDLITDPEEPDLKKNVEEAPKEIDEVVIDMDDDFDFSVAKKKKKKVSFVESTTLDAEPVVKAEDVTDTLSGLNNSESWTGEDRDYTYEELLTYLFHSIIEKNPDIVMGEKKRIILKPPQVLRVGTKKTSFANFYETCKSVHRQPKHLQAYLLSELGTNGSIDANCQLIIKGRFQQKQIENVLRRYIKEYVTCHTCHSPDTILQKDTRLFFLQCETCGSRCSVSSIKSGFQAVTGKRAAIRAKTG